MKYEEANKGKGGRADAQKERGGQRKERERGTLTWPHTRPYWARFNCGVSTILYCSQAYPISKYPTCLTFMIPCHTVFAGNPAAASESRSGSISSSMFDLFHCFFFFLFFSAKHNTSQDGQLRMLIFLHIGFSTGVQFNHVSICEISCLWNQHFGIITTNGGCVVPCSGQIVSPVLSWD